MFLQAPAPRKFLELLIMLCMLPPLASATQNPPEALADQFVAAWNSHDMKAFDGLFTDDAIWVPIAEVMNEGRAGIVKDLGEAHATWAKDTKIIRRGDMKVQRIRPDVAVLLFHLGFQDANGNVAPVIDRAMIIVAVRTKSGWKIKTGQITKQHEGA